MYDFVLGCIRGHPRPQVGHPWIRLSGPVLFLLWIVPLTFLQA